MPALLLGEGLVKVTLRRVRTGPFVSPRWTRSGIYRSGITSCIHAPHMYKSLSNSFQKGCKLESAKLLGILPDSHALSWMVISQRGASRSRDTILMRFLATFSIQLSH